MTEITQDPAAIKVAVQEHYSAAIRSAASCCGPSGSAASCCGPGDEIALLGVGGPAAQSDGLVTASFGCGNPLALASLQPGEVVLDLGSGGGLEVLLAARRVGPTGYAYGLDMTDAMLEVARKNAAKVGAENVAFLKGDIEAIPLPDASVDVIISNCVINLAPDKGRVLHEAFRALKPGGRLAVSDIVIDGDLSGLPITEAQIRTMLSWAGCIAGALTMDQYRALLADAGFAQVDLTVTQRYGPTDLRDLAPDTLAQVPAGVASALDGRFTSCAITAWKPA